MRTFNPWDVRDPATVLDTVLDDRRPTAGEVCLVLLLRADAPEQGVVDSVIVHQGDLPHRQEASELLREHASRLVGPRRWSAERGSPPQHVLVTVVCRSGRVVPGPIELFWFSALRFGNLSHAFQGDVYLVTEHGWTGLIDHRAGFAPSLRPRPLRLLSSRRRT